MVYQFESFTLTIHEPTVVVHNFSFPECIFFRMICVRTNIKSFTEDWTRALLHIGIVLSFKLIVYLLHPIKFPCEFSVLFVIRKWYTWYPFYQADKVEYLISK